MITPTTMRAVIQDNLGTIVAEARAARYTSPQGDGTEVLYCAVNGVFASSRWAYVMTPQDLADDLKRWWKQEVTL